MTSTRTSFTRQSECNNHCSSMETDHANDEAENADFHMHTKPSLSEIVLEATFDATGDEQVLVGS